MVGSVRGLPALVSKHHSKHLSISPTILENSFLLKKQFVSELYLIFKTVDKEVNVLGSLFGYQ